MNKTIKTIVALSCFSLFATINLFGIEYWQPENWKLTYEVENQTNEELVVTLSFDKGKPHSFWADVKEFFKPTPSFEEPKHEELRLVLSKGSKENGKADARANGSYKIYWKGKELAKGPIGQVLKTLPAVNWEDSTVKGDPQTKFSIKSTYDPSSKEAKFKFIIKSQEPEKKEL